MSNTQITPGQWVVKLGPAGTEVDYSSEVTAVNEQVSPTTVTVPTTFAASGFDDLGATPSSITLSCLFDLTDPDGLYYALEQADLEVQSLIVSPAGATPKPLWTYTVRVTRPSLPLTAGEYVQADVTLAVLGKPTITPPV